MIDIVKIKQAVKDGELKIYVRDLKVYLQNDIGEVVEIGKLEPDMDGGRRMTLFKIIDKKTGKEPTDEVITEQAELGNLITCDIDGFYVGEDGQIILVDDCGNCTWLDMSRFKVEMQNEASLTGAERSEK